MRKFFETNYSAYGIGDVIYNDSEERKWNTFSQYQSSSEENNTLNQFVKNKNKNSVLVESDLGF